MKSGLPLTLISQIQRSGGTLLSQLFDGHPQCAVYPHELKLNRPDKWNWPDLELDGRPDEWFDRLCHPGLARLAAGGYRKAGSNQHALARPLPFSLPIDQFRRRFLAECRRPPTSQRGILDAYLHAFFSAWANYTATGHEQVIVAFTPRVQMIDASVARLRRDYPEGKLLTIVRDPVRWYASASRHDPAKYGNLAGAMQAWRASADASLNLATALPASVRLICYEDLAGAPRDTMRDLAAFLGLAWDESLLTPTYCGIATLANSSFNIAAPGIRPEPLHRPLDLPSAVVDQLNVALGPTYASAAAVARSTLRVSQAS